jgi:hypothetical protein
MGNGYLLVLKAPLSNTDTAGAGDAMLISARAVENLH